VKVKSKKVWQWISPITFALAGTLFVASAITSHGNDLRGGDHGDLVALIRSQGDRSVRLTAQVRSLLNQTQHLTVERIDATLAAEERLVSAEAINTGEFGMRGPGAEVVLDDAPVPLGQPPNGLTLDDYVVHQQDLQGVANALWAGGAEAMSINGQRITALTSIRCVGNTLLLGSRVYSPPYRIRVIGNSVRLRGAVYSDPAVQLYLDYSKAIGLRWAFRPMRSVYLPPSSAPLAISYAKLGNSTPRPS